MRLFLVLWVLLTIIAFALLVSSNLGEEVSGITLLGTRYVGMSVVVVIVGSFVVGCLWGMLLGLVEGWRMRLTHLRLRRRVQELETRLETERSEVARPGGTAKTPSADDRDERDASTHNAPSAPVYSGPASSSPSRPDEDPYSGGSAV